MARVKETQSSVNVSFENGDSIDVKLCPPHVRVVKGVPEGADYRPNVSNEAVSLFVGNPGELVVELRIHPSEIINLVDAIEGAYQKYMDTYEPEYRP